MQVKPKFKVGDKVIRNYIAPHLNYSFWGYEKEPCKEGQVVVISAVGFYEDEPCYSIEGGEYKKPNWLSMESNFSLVKDLKFLFKRYLTN